MPGSSKILTVKYGTFSCTAEGFEDPLGAVKNTTHFFRSVVKQDRFFGAEPPKFDPGVAEDMLRQQIAADLHDGHVTLRPPHVDAGTPFLGDAAAPPAPPADDAPDHPDGDSTDTETAGPGPVDAAAHTRPETDTHGAEDSVPSRAVTAHAVSGEGSMTDKLARIRAVVGEHAQYPGAQAIGAGSTDDAALAEDANSPRHTRSESAQEETDAAEPAWNADAPTAFEGDGPALDDSAGAHPAATGDPIADRDAPRDEDSAEGDDAAATEAVIADAHTSHRVIDEDDDSDASADDLEAMLAGIRAQAADDPEGWRRNHDAHAHVPDDSGAADSARTGASEYLHEGAEGTDAFDDDAARPLTDEARHDRHAPHDLVGHDEDEIPQGDGPGEDPAPPAPVYDAAPKGAASDSAALADLGSPHLAPPRNEMDERADDAPVGPTENEAVDADDDEDQSAAGSMPTRPVVPNRRARVLKVKRALLDRPAPAEAEADAGADTDDGPNSVDAPILGPRSDRLRAESSLSDEEEADLARELAAVRAELEGAAPHAAPAPRALAPLRLDNPILDSDIAARFAEGDDHQDDKTPPAAQDDGFVARASAGARKAVRLASPARALLTEKSVGDSDTSRLLDQANSELDEPEGNRRRSAIAHLRAAVAATRADRALGRPDGEAAAEPYREDLATVVRPRRPSSGQSPRTARPAPEPQDAPLQLVAGQRVTDSGADPVRPRRVSREIECEEPEAIDADATGGMDQMGGGFAEYADSVGAHSLADMLEAAAAYIAFVEGRDQFSRPQLMNVLQHAEGGGASREDRLRSFGRLLRDGKIEKTRGGRFTASDSIGFRPAARRAG